MKRFGGLIPPMVTPLDERRRLDRTGVKNMVNHLVDGGADRSPLPLVVYDMPAHTDTTIEPATIAALAEMGLVKNVLAAPFAPFAGKDLRPVKAALAKLRKMGAE